MGLRQQVKEILRRTLRSLQGYCWLLERHLLLLEVLFSLADQVIPEIRGKVEHMRKTIVQWTEMQNVYAGENIC